MPSGFYLLGERESPPPEKEKVLERYQRYSYQKCVFLLKEWFLLKRGHFCLKRNISHEKGCCRFFHLAFFHLITSLQLPPPPPPRSRSSTCSQCYLEYLQHVAKRSIRWIFCNIVSGILLQNLSLAIGTLYWFDNPYNIK